MPGDKVEIHYKGRYVAGAKTIEYEDTFHSEKKLIFVVGDGTAIRGIEEGVQKMVPGEVVELAVSSDYGYGTNEHNGYVKKVPPNSDLLLHVSVMAVARDGCPSSSKAAQGERQRLDENFLPLLSGLLNMCEFQQVERESTCSGMVW